MGNFPIKILKDVPAGLKHIGRPFIDSELVSAMAPELPVATIILFLEHIAISKCKYPTASMSRSVDLGWISFWSFKWI